MYKGFVIFLILSWTNDSLGQNFDIDGRIVGGYKIDIADRKFQVTVIPAGAVCGGSLVQWNWVVTAAHCSVGLSSQQIKVYAGSNYAGIGIKRDVSSIFQQNYDPYTIDRDISLLKLTTPFAASSTIGIISLATVLPPDQALLTVSGYGAISEWGGLSTYLLAADVAKVSFKTCNTNYGYALTNSMFCAANPGKDSCQGDSGGPITYNGKLVGVVSFGNGCANPKFPGVYTSIPFFNVWITSTISLN